MSTPPGARLGRRGFLKRTALTVGLAAAAPALQACGATAPPATTATSPAEGPDGNPSAAAPTGTASAAPGEPTEAAGPAGANGAAEAPGPAVAVPPNPTPAPARSAESAVAALEKPRSDRKVADRLQILQNEDLPPDHNALVRRLLEEWGEARGWSMDISDVASFQGGSELNRKLVATVQAGTPPDLMDHNDDLRQKVFLGVLEPVTGLVGELEGRLGRAVHGLRVGASFDGHWWGVPYYTRAAGKYVRTDWLKEAGVDPARASESYNTLRATALTLSDPDRKRWGWGMTINRSGGGNSTVQGVVFAHGARVQDREGQRIVFDSPEAVAGVEWLKETYADPTWARARPPGVGAWNDVSGRDAFLAGTIGIAEDAGTMRARAYYDRVPHAEAIGYVQQPKSLDGRGPRLQSVGGETLRVLKGTRNRDAAYDTIRFWLSEGVQKAIRGVSRAGALPAYANGWRDALVAGDPHARGFEAAVNSQDWYGLATPGPITSAIGAIDQGNLFTDMMADVLRGTDPGAAVADTHRRMVRIFKEWGLKGD